MAMLDRRGFLLTSTSLTGVILATGSSVFAQTLKESESLAAKVNDGSLPPINERLPENPLVITPTERPGEQGGTWSHALVGGGSLSMLVRYRGSEPLMRFAPDWSGIDPNVAETYEVSADSKTYSFTLRKGMKWSDGHPCTTEDVRCWYEDIFQDETGAITAGQSFWFADGEPAQPSIVPGDLLYNERLARQHAEYDPDRANEILDSIVPERDSEGYRLYPNGSRVTIIFEIDQVRTTFLDMFELAIPRFNDIGVDAQIRTMDRSLWETRVRNGREFDASAHQFGANGGIAAMLDARYFVPFNRNAIYAEGWALYFTEPNNPDAPSPPEAVKAQQALYKDLLATGDPAEQQKKMAQILENAADMFLVFGVSLPPDG